MYCIGTLGNLSNDDGDVNENCKKAIGLDWRNNNAAPASRFFLVHFFAVTAPLRREDAWFHLLWKTWTQGNDFNFLSWTWIQSFRIQFQKKLPKKCDKVWRSATVPFKWRFRNCRRRCCLSSLVSSRRASLRFRRSGDLPGILRPERSAKRIV